MQHECVQCPFQASNRSVLAAHCARMHDSTLAAIGSGKRKAELIESSHSKENLVLGDFSMVPGWRLAAFRHNNKSQTLQERIQERFKQEQYLNQQHSCKIYALQYAFDRLKKSTALQREYFEPMQFQHPSLLGHHFFLFGSRLAKMTNKRLQRLYHNHVEFNFFII